MKRLLMVMMMVVVGAVVVRTQQEPIPNTIGGVENGLTWKSSSYSVNWPLWMAQGLVSLWESTPCCVLRNATVM